MEARWAHNPEVTGSSPVPATRGMEQLEARQFHRLEVEGSSPSPAISSRVGVNGNILG